MLKSILGIILLLVFTIVAFAQKDFTKEADNEFTNEGYYKAIELYKKAFSKEKRNEKKAEILYKIGECYRLTEDNKQAQIWFDKAIKANYPNPLLYLHFADAIKADGRYDEALVYYNQYKEKAPGDKLGDDGAKSCELAQKWKDSPARFEIQNEVLINSKFYDYSPTFEDKKYENLIFTSMREGSTGTEASLRTGESSADLYITKRDPKGKWSAPALVDGVNTDQEEGAAALNDKRNTIYFTRCYIGSKPGDKTNCRIFIAKKSGQRWDGAEDSKVTADSLSIGHPALNEDESTMIFAAELPGGYGGKDLWMSKHDNKTKSWSLPENLGSGINTSADEMFPYIHDDGSLYFSSSGHIGMGALDLFKAAKTGQDQWGTPENLKHPINSASNDFGIIFEGKKQKGYFSSNRPGGKGGDDIYSFYIPSLIYLLQGTITDVETKQPIEGAVVKLTGSDGSSAEIKTDKTGFYNFDQKPGRKDRFIAENTNYQIFVTKDGYLNSKGEETTVGVERSTTFIHDFAMQNFGATGDGGAGAGGGGKEIHFPEVLYDLAKWDLRPESKDSLNFLYQVLVDNPTIVIELAAHTDSRGSDASNAELSQKRAESCVNYLISKQIPAERMLPKGYGETRLKVTDAAIATLKTEVEKEAAHQKNRRTVFSVIRTNYVYKGN